MPRQEVMELYRQADLVVGQGGPGSILDAREAGHLPLAVPRRPELGEVVDAHQLAFTQVLQRHGDATMVTSYEQLVRSGTAVLQDPSTARTVPRQPGGALATERLERVVVDLDSTPRQRIAFRRARQVWLRR